MTLPIVWRPAARVDLFTLYDWIAGETGRETAYSYTSAIEAVTAGLGEFLEREAPRPDLAAGVRTLAYRRRTVIPCRVLPEAVEIVALAHGGHDLGGTFDGQED